MAHSTLKLKLEKLKDDETFSSFCDWKALLLHELRKDNDFQDFITKKWARQSPDVQHRGLDDKKELGLVVRTAAKRAEDLEHMLELIARFVPHYLSNDIVNESTRLNSVWQFIRQYYGFQSSEATFMDSYMISWEEGERPERLYRRLRAHICDNLLKADGSIKHDGTIPTKDEVLSPTVERMIAARWLDLLHPGLLALVKRHYAMELERRSLKDLQPAIVNSLNAFLEELQDSDVKVNRTYNPKTRQFFQRPSRGNGSRPRFSETRFPQPTKPTSTKSVTGSVCRVCFAEGRDYSHPLGDCLFISVADKRTFLKSFRVEVAPADVQPEDDEQSNPSTQELQCSVSD